MDLVPYEHSMKVIGGSWKFKLKRDGDGNITKFKARLVARGDQQEPDKNYVFSPNVGYTGLEYCQPSHVIMILKLSKLTS